TGDLVLTKDALYQLSYPGRTCSAPHSRKPLPFAAHVSLAASLPRFGPLSNIASCDCPAVIANHFTGDRFAATTSANSRTENWWTGEDSNLRSPQGAADLQSAGFSHSPTRPRKIPARANYKSQKRLLEKTP